jgi:hypothetical protein
MSATQRSQLGHRRGDNNLRGHGIWWWIFRCHAPGVDGQAIRRAVMTTLMIMEACVITLPLPVLALVALLRTPRRT